MQGTDEADAAQADTATAEVEQTAETASEAQVPQTQADEATAQTEAVDTADTTAPADAADDTAQASLSTADVTDAPPADADADDTAQASLSPDDVTDAPPADEAASDEAEAASDMPEVALDSTEESDGRPLGAADAIAEQVEEAVERMEEAAAVAEAGSADGAAADVAEEAVVPLAPARPAPRVYEGPEPTTMEELLNEQATEIRSLKHGDVVEGAIVRIDKDEILVDIGAKSEGVVSNRELYGRHAEAQPVLAVGDVVLVYVLQPESEAGHAVLSLRRAGLERKWRSMQEQFEAGVIIEAPVIDHNKGGLIVDCGIRGFVPISQIVDFPRRPQNDQPRDAAQEIAEKLQPFVGRKLRLKILEVNRKANRLILSEKVALYEERREKRDELFSSLQVGQKVTGSVRSIAPFGVFIDLGGIDGLVHKSELSWNKVNNPESGYKVGDEVEAEVIDINHERGRISLSIRRLQPDPWNSTVADFKVGDIIDGTVTKIVNFGAFVRVRDGLEGLIHISELSHQRVAHPGDVVHEGQQLKLKIISLDSDRHRLGLSLKQAEEAPARPAAPEPRERRGRSERSYDASQAIQEPEGGIDNTLAAAFAQVRQQMAASEGDGGSTATETAEPEQPAAEAPAAEAAAEEPLTASDVVEAVAADEMAEEAAAAEEIAELQDAAAANEANEAPAAADIADVVLDVAADEEAEEAAAADLIASLPDEPAEAPAAEEATTEGPSADA